MADSPQLHAEGVVRLSILSSGRQQSDLSVLSVQVHHALNDVPWARLVLADGDMANGSVPLSDGELFEPGADIAVKAGYGDVEETIFTGIVVRHSFGISGGDGRLSVLCRARACKMTEPRRTVLHGRGTDAEVLQTLIGNAGLTARVAKTDIDREVLVQRDCSDWDYMLARAGAMGLMVNVEGDTVSVQPPPTDAAAVLTLTWGVDLIDFDADAEASRPCAVTQASLRGRMSFQGSALARPGAVVELAGLGKRFSGPVLLSSVEHEISDGEWITRAGFGLDLRSPDQPPGLPASSSSGLLPGAGGLQTGVVLQLDGDPQGQHRILVRTAACQGATEGLWARVLQLQASAGFGSFFLPEVGDEVLLGHLDQDPAQPVVLGSLYGSSRTPPYPLTAGNAIKAVVTRSRHRIEFNDADKVITITTPARNQLVFSDQEQAIEVKDQSGNVVRLSPAGIALDSPRDITLAAQGVITLEAVGAIAVRSKGDVNVEGLNVACQAQVGISAKGAAAAELSSSGQTTVKGAMVMIN
ncbi:phage baseplate assembly protein V [Ideonella sp. YS5]|uniref:phage baseplate assembly protein V n=1 Tax=Ideonella sp. YS5 TaxID=3453714 RepID=UPI003EEAA019